MKLIRKIFIFILFLSLSGCGIIKSDPPSDIDLGYPEEVVLSADNEDVSGDQEEISEEVSNDENSEILEGEENIEICQDKNAEISLLLEKSENDLLSCQKSLRESPNSNNEISISEKHKKILRSAIKGSDQVEFPFQKCGQMSNFFQSGFFGDFKAALASKKIRFSNGYLETEDLFGGCESSAGNMAFFLGAKRNEDREFLIIKYDFNTRGIELALFLDNPGSSVVNKFGKREGPFVNFPSDDGRNFKYYFDSNIVILDN